jgi:hypothetical protein
MTREERRAELKALEARRATMAFAKHAAKRQLQAQIKARGERVSNYSHKELTLMAEALMANKPELVPWRRAWVTACEKVGGPEVAINGPPELTPKEGKGNLGERAAIDRRSFTCKPASPSIHLRWLRHLRWLVLNQQRSIASADRAL